MGSVIGELLPLSLAIAISPLSIISVILMLLSPNARRTGPGFLIGWVLGLALPLILFVFFAGFLPPHHAAGGPNVVRAIVQFVLAALLILLAVAQWRAKPAAGAEPALPKWMSAIDSFSFGRALGLGLLLAIPRPKNLLISASAAVAIGGSGLTAGAEGIAMAVFVLCAASTVLLPVLAFFLAAERLREPLDAIHRWLARENTVITAVLLLVVGVLMLGKAIGSL